MQIQEKLSALKRDRKAILATNFYNLETLQGVLLAANRVQQPIILQLSKSSIDYIGLNMAVKMARQALSDYQVEGWLHLDHGNNIDLVRQCLDAGFDSVMIDASENDFRTNVSITSEVVRLAKAYKAHVEAELGFVPKLGQKQTGFYTNPLEAKAFVELTGVDALAVAIGSAHGFYKEKPNLRIDILYQIYEMTHATLVLHGSSGIPDEMLVKAIQHGITKINLATEIKNAFMHSVKSSLMHTDEIDLRKIFPAAIESVSQLVSKKLIAILLPEPTV